MHCRQVQAVLDELKPGETPAQVLEHLAGCSACEEYARGWRQLRGGFRALAVEEVPEPSLGFPARLARRLGQAADESRLGAEFLERVGRRFVYATALLMLTVLLAWVLPSSGPWRGPATPEVYLAQPEIASLGSDPVFSEGSPDSPDDVLVNTPPKGENTQR